MIVEEDDAVAVIRARVEGKLTLGSPRAAVGVSIATLGFVRAIGAAVVDVQPGGLGCARIAVIRASQALRPSGVDTAQTYSPVLAIIISAAREAILVIAAVKRTTIRWRAL